MNILDILNIPLGYIIKAMYFLTGNYAASLFLFALIVKIIMIPLSVRQQNSQIKMAKLRPREQAIRRKYAGRKDTATQQKMQTEIMEFYKTENYSPMGGCLPLLIQFPIIIALYNIVRNPLTYILSISGDILTNLKTFVFDNFAQAEKYAELFKGVTKPEAIDQIRLVKILDDPANLTQIKQSVSGLSEFVNINFKLFGFDLTDAPSQLGISLLLLIPLLNLAVSFAQMRITKKFNPNPAAADTQNNASMKMLEYITPLMSLYFSYVWSSALGLYWFYQSALGIAQTLIIAKLMPMPVLTEEDYRQAEAIYGSKKKKKKKPALEPGESGGEVTGTELTELAEEPAEEPAESEGNEGEADKYISQALPKGIDPAVKKIYQKTGKRYSVKKKKKD